jgi:hypothetical protein
MAHERTHAPQQNIHSITSSAVENRLFGTVRPSFGGLEVEHHLELGRRLRWQVGRLFTEDAVGHPDCARAASGQAAAAPPTSVMNSRRFMLIRSPRRQRRGAMVER